MCLQFYILRVCPALRDLVLKQLHILHKWQVEVFSPLWNLGSSPMTSSNPTFYDSKKGTQALNRCLEGLNLRDWAPENRSAYSKDNWYCIQTTPFFPERLQFSKTGLKKFPQLEAYSHHNNFLSLRICMSTCLHIRDPEQGGSARFYQVLQGRQAPPGNLLE